MYRQFLRLGTDIFAPQGLLNKTPFTTNKTKGCLLPLWRVPHQLTPLHRNTRLEDLMIALPESSASATPSDSILVVSKESTGEEEDLALSFGGHETTPSLGSRDHNILFPTTAQVERRGAHTLHLNDNWGRSAAIGTRIRVPSVFNVKRSVEFRPHILDCPYRR